MKSTGGHSCKVWSSSLIVSEHEGLKAARLAVLAAFRGRCQSAIVKFSCRAIFGAQTRTEADALLKRTVQKYEASAPKLAFWLEENLPEGLTVFAFPEPHRRLLRTANGVERVNREIRRRTQVASIYANITLMEISDDWQSGKAYLTFTEKSITEEPTL